MNEKIAIYNKEVDNINLVLNKLKEKQNSSVFDKLCVKCDTLLRNISANDPASLTSADRHSIIDVLKRLLDICITLQAYKQYLIGVINNNIIMFSNTPSQNEFVETLEQPTNVVPINNPQTLQLENNERNAA